MNFFLTSYERWILAATLLGVLIGLTVGCALNTDTMFPTPAKPYDLQALLKIAFGLVVNDKAANLDALKESAALLESAGIELDHSLTIAEQALLLTLEGVQAMQSGTTPRSLRVVELLKQYKQTQIAKGIKP